jgi:hypothetical protein
MTWFATGVKHSWNNKSPSKRMLNAIKKRDRHIEKLNLKAGKAPVIHIYSSGEEGSDSEEALSSQQLVSSQSSSLLPYCSPYHSPTKRGRTPSLSQIGDKEGQERSLSRTRLVRDQSPTSSAQRKSITREERERQQQQRQITINEMQAELDSDIRNSN